LRDGDGYYRIFSRLTPNPNVGWRPAAILYEGYGGAAATAHWRTNCPFAFDPRLGVAYQLNSRTVLRIGSGVSCYKADNNNLGFPPDLSTLFKPLRPNIRRL
jgi:hypothetical protein